MSISTAAPTVVPVLESFSATETNALRPGRQTALNQPAAFPQKPSLGLQQPITASQISPSLHCPHFNLQSCPYEPSGQMVSQ